MTDRQVKVTLVIDEKGAVKAMRSAGDESARTEGKFKGLDKQVKGLGSSFGGLKNMVGMGLGALGVGGLAFGLSDIASKTKEVAAETEKFHSITGIGATQSLQYTQALKARGLSGESVSKAFGFLAKNIRSAELQEAKYTMSQTKAVTTSKAASTVLGRQAMALKELGIGLTQFNRLSEAQKIEEITKKFEALAPGIQKTRLERELFGRGGNQLSIVLEKNNLGLSHQMELVKKFFPEIKGGANAMNELLEKQAESKMAWEGLEFTIGQKLIPIMTSLMGTFSKVVQEVEQGKGSWGELRGTFEGVAGVVKSIWEGFSNLVGPSNALKSAVGGFVAIMAVEKVVKFGSAISSLAFAPEFIAAAGTFLLMMKGLEALAGKPILKMLGEETGLLPHTVTTTNVPGHPSLTGAQTHKAAIDLLRTPGALAQSLKQDKERHEAPGAAELQATKIDFHIDSVKIAEAFLKNPRTRRQIAEATAIYSQQMTARK